MEQRQKKLKKKKPLISKDIKAENTKSSIPKKVNNEFDFSENPFFNTLKKIGIENGGVSEKELSVMKYIDDIVKEEIYTITSKKEKEEHIRSYMDNNFKKMLSQKTIEVACTNLAKLSALIGGVSTAAGSSLLTTAPAFVAAGFFLQQYNNHNKNVEHRKRIEENYVKRYMKYKESDELKVMDALRFKYYSSEKHMNTMLFHDMNKHDKKNVFQSILYFWKQFTRKMFDVLTFNSKGKGINKKLEKAQKKFFEYFGSTHNVQEKMQSVVDETYNEFLSKNLEDYVIYKIENTIEHVKRSAELNEQINEDFKKGDYTIKPHHMTRIESERKIEKNIQELEEIANIEGINLINKSDHSPYYSGSSRTARIFTSNFPKFRKNPELITRTSLIKTIEKHNRIGMIEHIKNDVADILNTDMSDATDRFFYQRVLATIMSSKNREECKEKVLSAVNMDDAASEIREDQTHITANLFNIENVVDKYFDIKEGKHTEAKVLERFDSKVKDIIEKEDLKRKKRKGRFNPKT